jgi:7-cyano-7-deazaguanine synthase
VCGIGGVLNFGSNTFEDYNGFLNQLTQRGRDSLGIMVYDDQGRVSTTKYLDQKSIGSYFPLNDIVKLMMVNVRAVPTSFSEGNVKMEDGYLQPYVIRGEASPKQHRAIIHNGTIANDDTLNKTFDYLINDDNGAVYFDRRQVPIDSTVFLNYSSKTLCDAIRDQEIVGSFSGALWDEPEATVVLFKNYMPLHIMIDYTARRVWWSNVKEALYEVGGNEVAYFDVPAYTSIFIPYHRTFDEVVHIIKQGMRKGGNLYGKQKAEKALVVCSSGLDSTTVAALAVKKYGKDNVTLLHYNYGCKAESREQFRIVQIAERLGCSYKIVDISTVFAGMKSPILGTNGDISKGDAGVEYAKEWVPARNLIMMSVALGVAEDGGFSTIQLGANLTEQASFPDNSLDFTEKLNVLSAYAVQNNVRIRVEAPLVNLMKQEIVKIGIEVNTPYELTWSCYHNGETHCGECAPCQMRKQAFEMNGLVDPVMKG